MGLNLICKIEGCEGVIFNKANCLCNKHYLRFLRHGDPLGGSSFRNAKEWMKEHSSYSGDDCLIWPWARNENGYGTTKGGLASRIMCEVAHGKATKEKPVARHLCGNGHLGCVNPKHLEWSTNSVNQMDRVKHGTSNRGERNGQVKLTRNDVIEIYTSSKCADLLATKFEISSATVHDIKKKRTWKWFTDQLDFSSRFR